MLTLAVNLAVMTRRVLRGAVLHDVDGRPRRRALAGRRRRWIRALLIAIGLIFVELMLVTAMALFFSTFSSPLLATLLTFGLWVAGHFNADLRNFGNVVDSPAAGAVARAVYYVLPNLAPFDVKARSRPRHRRWRCATWCSRSRTRAVYITHPADRRRWRFSAAAISSDA